MAGLMSALENLLTARPALRGEFSVVTPQSLGHATVPRPDVGTELLDILAREGRSFVAVMVACIISDRTMIIEASNGRLQIIRDSPV